MFQQDSKEVSKNDDGMNWADFSILDSGIVEAEIWAFLKCDLFPVLGTPVFFPVSETVDHHRFISLFFVNDDDDTTMITAAVSTMMIIKSTDLSNRYDYYLAKKTLMRLLSFQSLI